MSACEAAHAAYCGGVAAGHDIPAYGWIVVLVIAAVTAAIAVASHNR